MTTGNNRTEPQVLADDTPGVVVYGRLTAPDGRPASGFVLFELDFAWPHDADARIIAKLPVYAHLDEEGQFRATVVASDDPGWRSGVVVPYRVTVSLVGQRYAIQNRYIFPAGPDLDFSKLAPIQETAPVPVYFDPVPGPQGPPGPQGEKGDPGTGSSGPTSLDELTDVEAPADTPVGQILGMTSKGKWAPIDPPATLPDPWATLDSWVPQWTPEQSWSKSDVCFNDGEYWVIWYDAPSKVDDPLMDEPTRANEGGNAWFHLDLPYAGSTAVEGSLKADTAAWGLNAAAGGKVSQPAAAWTPTAYFEGYLVRHQPVEFGPYYLYVALETTGPTDVPGESPKWRLAYITDGTLGGLTDVTAPADTPVGKVLGTTADGQWGPVDYPESDLPPTEHLRPTGSWVYVGVGATTLPGEIKINSATSVTTLRVNPLDSSGRDWSSQIDSLVIGDELTLTHAGAPWTVRVRGQVNTSGSRNIPIEAIPPGTFVASEAIHLEFPPIKPSALPGDVLTLDGGLVPEWQQPRAGALDDLTDVDVSDATTGLMLTKQPGGIWKGAAFNRPLNWLSDVSTGTIDEDGNPVAPDQTPARYVLGTSGVGMWEPLSLDYIEEQIVTPLQQEIGDPRAVAAHTDLVGFISEVDQRLSAIEVTEAVVAERHLFVDKYDGSFIRVMVVPPTGPWPAKVDFALATTPGVNGVVYPDLGSVAGGPAVYADFGGSLGRLYMADGNGIYGSTLKEWIRRGTIATVHRDDTDPARPNLIVEKVEQPTDAGTSLALNTLRDVTAPDTTPAGKVLGTTAEGQWGPVDYESRIAALEARIAALEAP